MSDLKSTIFSVIGTELDDVDGFPLIDDNGMFYGSFSCAETARVAIDNDISKKRELTVREPYRYVVYMSKLDDPVKLTFYDVWNYHYTSLEEGLPFWVDYAYNSEIIARQPLAQNKLSRNPKIKPI